MTDMDVSLRLRLVNQLSRPAEEAERDLKDLKKAAEQLGRTKGGDGLARGLADISQKADTAKAGLTGIKKEADQLRQAIGRTGSGFDNFKADAAKAEASIAGVKDKADNARLAISRIGEGFGNLKADAMNAEGGLQSIQQQAGATKAAIGRIGDGAFQTLTGDAVKAEAAIRQIGAAADVADEKLRGLRGPITGGGLPGTRGTAGLPHTSTGGGLVSTVEGAVDQFGVPLAIGAGGAYLAGAGPAGLVVAGGAAVNAAGRDEFAMDQLQTTGGFSEEEKRAYQEMLGRSGARRGIGTQGAMSVFGALQAGGLSSDDAAKMTDDVTVFAKATQSDPADAANTAVALRNNMGIPADKMMQAYDAMAVGGKEGQFEVKDMSRQFPSMLAAMSSQGSTGFAGVNLATAMAQAIRKTTGSGDQAKTRFEALLSDLTAPEIVDRAKKMGFNPNKAKQSAIKNGEDPVLAMIEGYQKVVGGNEPRFKELFRNSESYAGLAAIFKDIDAMKAMIGRMQKADGTVTADYETSTSNFSSQTDRLSSNVGKNIKDMAAPLLPYLTKAVEFLSKNIEDARDAPDKDPAKGVPGVGLAMEGLKFYLQSTTDKGEDPSALKRFLFGRGAEEGFDFRDHVRETMGRGPKKIDPALSGRDVPAALGSDFGSAAEKAMGGYNEALAAEGEKAKAEAQSIADYIKSILGFTVSPTISPTFISPGGGTGATTTTGDGSGKQSSVQSSNTGVKLTQNISSPNSRVAGIRAQREANRSVRMAQSRALGDIGPRTA